MIINGNFETSAMYKNNGGEFEVIEAIVGIEMVDGFTVGRFDVETKFGHLVCDICWDDVLNIQDYQYESEFFLKFDGIDGRSNVSIFHNHDNDYQITVAKDGVVRDFHINSEMFNDIIYCLTDTWMLTAKVALSNRK